VTCYLCFWQIGNVALMPPLTSGLPFISESISLFRRIWPVAGLAAAVIVNVVWMGFLGYGFFKLVGLFGVPCRQA
jgi:hypothetical protein